MKKLLVSLSALALTAIGLTGCEDVPQPYDTPTADDSQEVVIEPKGTGTQNDPFNVIGALNFIDEGENLDQAVYVSGYVVKIDNIDTSFGNATYYISDDSTSTTTTLEVYRGRYLGGENFTSTDQLKVGDKVVVCGQVVNYEGTKEFTSGNYIYSLNNKTAGGSGDDESDALPEGNGTQASPYNVAAALNIVTALAAGEETSEPIYVKGKIVEIRQVETAIYGNANYYISDDGKNRIYIFQSLYLGGEKFTSEDQIKVGDEVVVYGKFTNYMGNTPETVGKGQTHIVSLNGKQDASDEPAGLSADFSKGDNGFTIKNISLPEGLSFIWNYDSENGYFKANAYASRKNYAGQSRLVSPAFNLKGLSKATLTFNHMARFFKDAASELKVQVSTDGTNWTDLAVSAYPSGENWDITTSTCDLSSVAGAKKVYIGFLYTSTTDAAATWEVTSVEVK